MGFCPTLNHILFKAMFVKIIVIFAE